MTGRSAVPPAPSTTDVRAALDRVLTSTEFRRSARSRDFLSYVVTETLAGRGDRLSERTVGRHGLGQPSDFDGSGSASVRVRASRTRTSLEAYYADEGRDDPVRIAIPPGGYVAVFESRPAEAAVERTVPGIAVVALSATGGELAGALAASLSDSLTHRLARYPHVRVVGPTALTDGMQRTGAQLGVSTVLDGQVVERAGAARVSLRLCATRTGEVVWSTDRSLSAADLAGLRVEDMWAAEIAALLGDTTGPVVREELARPRGEDTDAGAEARLAFYSYVDRGTVDSLTDAADLLDRALERERAADLLTMRAALANAAQAFGLVDRQPALDAASAWAREALTLDGGNAHAHLVLASVAHYGGHRTAAVEHAETAVALSPYHPSYLVGAGGTLCGCGEWDRGTGLIREAQRLNPGLTGRSHTWLAADHLVHGDHARALAEAGWLPADGGFVWGPLYRAMALAGLGHTEQARAELELARAMRPDVVDDPAAFFRGQMDLSTEELEGLVALVRAAAEGCP